jgi:hypothetical protein
MEPVEVTARFDLQGEITPMNLVKDQKTIPVTGVGRRWSDSQGVHILVMVPGGQIFELLFAYAQNRWFMSSTSPELKWA